ncbi:MAG: aspartate kinase [Holosporales bacterium]|jgi:aspartate kinase|nr:aspartate kinase [Holosporales bacterium]
MARIVQKFGGSSVATEARIALVAERVETSLQKGDQVVLVVSAMAGVTNELIGLARQFSGEEGHPEYDVVVSSGEQMSAGLMALALAQRGIRARSFLSWQMPLLTDDRFSCAEILGQNFPTLESTLQEGIVPVISGFQGVTSSGQLTTLGRGGSDLTAVVVASVLHTSCETYKDVEGIYTADPNIVPAARCLSTIDGHDMLALAVHGSKVLQARSVVYAIRHKVSIHVRSSFSSSLGTQVTTLSKDRPEFCGVACALHLVAIEIAFSESSWTLLQNALSKTYVPFDVLKKQSTTALLLFNRGDLQEVRDFCASAKEVLSWNVVPMDRAYARLTIVGKESIAHRERFKECLRKAKILVQDAAIPSEEASFLVPAAEAVHGARVLHQACGLDR